LVQLADAFLKTARFKILLTRIYFSFYSAISQTQTLPATIGCVHFTVLTGRQWS
jgi:hypothetical protein